MREHITGIACWNDKTQKWQHYCLPTTINKSLIPTQIRVENRAFGFGLTPIGDWKINENTHYRDFTTEQGDLRRAFIISQIDETMVKSKELCLTPPTEVQK